MAEPTQTAATPGDHFEKMAFDEPLEDFLTARRNQSSRTVLVRARTIVMLNRMYEHFDLGVAYRESE